MPVPIPHQVRDRLTLENALRAWSRCICAIDGRGKSVSVTFAGRSLWPGLHRRAGRGVVNRALSLMSAAEPDTSAGAASWIANQPYLLLSITALCWAGNAIVGRLAAGHIPPVTLSFLRWSMAFLIILPFAFNHLARDWATLRSRLGIMIFLSITGIGAFNTLQYWASNTPRR